MIYGYARVSTDAQDLSSQLAQLEAAGWEEIFRERFTGAPAERPQLEKLLATATPSIRRGCPHSPAKRGMNFPAHPRRYPPLPKQPIRSLA